MGLGDLYYKLEEKYYASLDWFDSKGLHFFYKIDEWLQSKNIPSFPVVTLCSFLLVVALIFLILFLTGVFSLNTVDVTFQFVDVSNNATVSGLSVSLTYGTEVLSETTDNSGEIVFRVPKNEALQLSIISEKYILQKDSFSYFEDSLEKINLLDKEAFLASKTLKLFSDLDSSILFSDVVELDLTCSDNSTYIKKKTVSDGIVDLTDLPSDCGQLIVSSNNPAINKTISVGIDSMNILVDGAKTVTAELRVIAQDELGNPLKNIEVSAYTEDNFYYDGEITSETGLVSLNLPLAKYYVNLNDPSNEYSIFSTKDSVQPGCYETLQENLATVCTVTMKQSNVGKIKLMVLDVSGKPIKEAQVKIYKGEIEILDKLSPDQNGLFVKGMPEQGPYRVVIDSPNYMLYDNTSVYVSDVPLEVHLEPIKDNTLLQVYVTANSDPVALANVQLLKEGNLILTKATGADGIAYFDRLEAGKVYSAKVVKGDYSQTSNTITLDARTENKLEVQMVIGKGNVDVKVVDKDSNPLSASVELYNLYSDKLLSTAQTDALGVAHFFGISADKTVYAKVTANNAVNYTLSKDISANKTIELNSIALSESSTLNLDLLGIYNLDNTQVLTNPYDVVLGTEYYALFNLSVPKGKPFSQGDLFFIGDAKNSSDSSILIKKVEVLNGVESKGVTYNAPLGYAEDMLNKTTDDALWSNAKLSKVNAGNNLVKVSFVIVNEPKTTLFKMGYRASLKSGTSIVRTPVDDLLGQNESVPEKLGFYADTQNVSFKAGELYCSNGACIEINAQDSFGNKTQVIDELSSVYNGITAMSFNIAPAGKVSYKNVTLKIESKNLGVNISNVAVMTNNKKIEVQGKGPYTATLPSFTQSSDISGSLGFVTNKVGETVLVISMLSEKNEVIFSKEIKVIVESPNNLVAEYVPSVIVPYIINLGAIVVTDTTELSPVSDALVSVYLNDILIKTEKTDSEGKLPLEIDKPNSGDILKIKVSAPGYNNIEFNIKITENILVADKPDVTIYLDPMENETSNLNLVLSSYLPNKLKITKVGFSNTEYSDLIELKTNVTANKVFDGNLQLDVNAKLTSLGKSVLDPKLFKTNLELSVFSDELNRTWLVQVPIILNIRLSESLDASECLTLNVEESTDMTTFKLVNKCLYKSKETNLYNATAFLEWDGQVLGDYYFNTEKISDEGLIVLKEVKPKTNTFNLKFVDNAKYVSGQSKVNVIIKAYYPTNSGLQEVVAKKELVVSVSDYKKCLQVISSNGTILNADTVASSPIVLGVTTLTTGYSMLNGYYGNMLSASSNSGYALGNANLFGNGATTYNNGTATTNTFDYLQQLSGIGDPRTTVTGSNNNLLGLGTQSTNNSVLYGQTNTANSRYSTGNTFTNLLNQNYAYQEEYNELQEDTIYFDNYPYTPNVLSNNVYGNNALYSAYSGVQSPYMLGQYGAMMQNQYLPTVNTVQFRNNCISAVDVEIRSMPQIQVGPNTLTIQPKQTSQVTVMSGMLPGTYTMNVLAGTSGNLNPLMTIPVNVIDYVTNTANENCFKLSEEPTINMSSALKRNKIIKVYNYCYSKGVIFDDSQPISLQNLYTRKEVLTNLISKKDNAQRISEAKKKANACKNSNDKTCSTNYSDYLEEMNTDSLVNSSNNVPYVVASAIGVPNVENSATYGQYQVLQVMLDKDPSIQRLISDNITKTGRQLNDTINTISALRIGLTELYNNVEFPAIFVINARIGYGTQAQKRSIQKLVTVRDLFNLAGLSDILDGLMTNKDCVPNVKYLDKTSKNQMTWDEKGNITNEGSYTINSNEFVNGYARIPNTSGFDLLNTISCFGSGDTVEFKSIENVPCGPGKLEITPHYDSGKIYFDIKAIGEVNCNSLDIRLEYTIKSPLYTDLSYKDMVKQYTLHLRFNGSVSSNNDTNNNQTTNPDGSKPKELSVESKTCQTKYGTNWKSLKDYGFGSSTNLGNMLSFDYSKTIDCTKTFCDAEQLKKFLEGKFTKESIYSQLKFKEFLKTKYAVENYDNNKVLTLTADKVLDSLSLNNLKTNLTTYMNKTQPDAQGLKEFQSLVVNMPDLFLVTNTCPQNSSEYAFTNDNKCYFNALKLLKVTGAENIMRANFAKEFDVVFLISENNYQLAVLHNNYSSGSAGNGNYANIIYKVYLKPDNYNVVFKNNGMLSYTASTVTSFDSITNAEVCVVYPFIATNDKLVKISKANSLLSGDEKLFFYNLAVDPTARANDYKGEYGLCVAQGRLPGLITTITECNNFKFVKQTKFTESSNNYLIFENISKNNSLINYELNYPKCDSDSSGCSINGIRAPKESYNINTIFNNANKYCYIETNNKIEIKYNGGVGATAPAKP